MLLPRGGRCGEDTDCTGATVGAIFGLLHGVEAIPQRWIDPIGRKIRTACLNLGELGHYGSQLPQDIDDLTERTARIAQQVILRHRLPLVIARDKASDLSDLSPQSLLAGPAAATLYENMGGPVFRFDFFDVAVDYGGDPTIREHTPKTIRLRMRNTYKVQANLTLRWYTPEGWRVLPARSGMVFSAHAWLGGGWHEVEFTLEAERVESAMSRLVVELTIDGRPTVMLVPVTLLNGNLCAS